MPEIDKKHLRMWSMLGMSRIFGSILEDLLEEDDKFVLAVADVGRVMAYNAFLRKYPERVFEMGIAEQNLINASAGLVNEGFDVFASTYSTFLTARGLDQIRVNMGLMQLPLKLVGIGGGLGDGSMSATHMGLEDVANMSCIPGMTVIVPCDGLELVKTLFALLHYDKPAYVKLTGESGLPVIYSEDYEFEIGKSNVLKEGNDIAIIANGAVMSNVLEAAGRLEEENISCKVIDMHTVSPIDEEALESLMNMKMIFTVEEHCVRGGLGSAVAQWYADKPMNPPISVIGVDGQTYPLANEYSRLMEVCGLDSRSIYRTVREKYAKLFV